MNTDAYRVAPQSTISLSEWDPNAKNHFSGSKTEGRTALKALNKTLRNLQALLYAEGKHRVLIILQALDAGGKDGTVRHVFKGVNPQGVRVVSFKKPSPAELARDYLWRVHQQVPQNGEITIFNRSHYEDVLVVRVNDLVSPEVWSKRFEHIKHFEKMLADEGTTILKFFLHIDPAEQKERFQARLDDPRKHWKFNPDDLKTRARWGDFMTAYEEVLSQTSTQWAPWYIVPANRKWYRNLVISSVIIETLENLGMEYPRPNFDPRTIHIP